MNDRTRELNGVELVDPGLSGRPGIIATGLIRGPIGLALVDPGPTASLEGLRRALEKAGARVSDLEAVLVTHIHLDHAGATGSLVRENPRLRVFVHERGAPHLIDPERLLQSASRLYGEGMDRLWGETVGVPPANVQMLRGGERLQVAGRPFDVEYTPGHASHHVSYFDREARVAFVGDTGGIRAGDSNYLVPPTPPPDIDVEAWSDSLDRIKGWKPEALFVTHFGFVDRPEERLEILRRGLFANAEMVRRSLAEEGTDEERLHRFVAAFAADLRQHMSEEEAVRYETAVPLEHCWLGLARYWRKGGGKHRAMNS